MARRVHTAAVEYALEQELLEKGEEIFRDEDHRRSFHNRLNFYLGSVKRGERVVHYWWIRADEEMMTIDEGPGGVIVSGNLESPLNRIPKKKMTIEQLEASGLFKIPAAMMRELTILSEMGASVLGPLEHEPCDVMLPLLGIEIIPESDAENVWFDSDDWDTVSFYRKNT